jgi:hypothetical protein
MRDTITRVARVLSQVGFRLWVLGRRSRLAATAHRARAGQ